ncbi:MAG TPA: hypothetical protein HA224_01165 [Nanoarchaeota archaeon]|nr:hypothetical protein [Nanoarchaeota archaeon]
MDFIEALAPPRNEDFETLIFAPAGDLSEKIKAYVPYNPAISTIASSVAGAEMAGLLIANLLALVSHNSSLKQYSRDYGLFGEEISRKNKKLQELIKTKNLESLLRQTKIDVRIAEKFLPETIRYIIYGAVAVCKDTELAGQLEKIRKRNYGSVSEEEFLAVLAEQEQIDKYCEKGLQQAKEWRARGLFDAVKNLKK